MFSRLFRLSFRLGLLGGIGFAIFRVVQARRPSQDTYTGRTEPWPPAKPAPRPEPSAAPAAPPKVAAAPKPAPAPAKAPAPAAKKASPAKKAEAPVKKAAPAAKAAPDRAWVEPSGDGVCPTSHPIKAKLSSKIFHLPGMFAYDRCRPDRCYAAEDTATADGLTKAKR